MHNKVVLNNFQVTAFYALSECGHSMTPKSINGVPAEYIGNVGTYMDMGDYWRNISFQDQETGRMLTTPDIPDEVYANDTEEQLRVWLEMTKMGWDLQKEYGHEYYACRYLNDTPYDPQPVPGFEYEDTASIAPAENLVRVATDPYHIGIGCHIEVDGVKYEVTGRELTTVGIKLICGDVSFENDSYYVIQEG